MNEFTNIFITIITTGGLGFLNYAIAESVSALDSDQKGTSREKSISALFTTIDLLIYVAIANGLKLIIHNNFVDIIAASLTIAISLLISFKLAKPTNNLFYKIINKQCSRSNLISIQSGSPWKQIALGDDRPQAAYLYSFEHKPLGFGWVQYVSNDQESNYSLGLVPFDDEIEEAQPSYDKLTSRIQNPKYKEKHQVNQFVDFKQRFIMITSIRLENSN